MNLKQPLGRLFLILLLGVPLFAGVRASVDAIAVFKGDPVTLTLSAEGEKVEFPPLSDIAGYSTQTAGTSRNLSIINGQKRQTIEKRLQFVPSENVTIPSFDITVDGKTEHTLPIYVKVMEPKEAPAGSPVKLEMKLEKDTAYVGEAVRLDLIFRVKPRTRVDDLRISEPKLENFWIKQLDSEPEKGVDSDGYTTRTYSYLLFAQKSGDLEIPAIFAQVGTQVRTQSRGMFGDAFFNDPFFSGARMQYKKLFSNAATLHAKALPEGLEVYGSFTLNTDIDKQKVAVNKPVNLHIHIEGEGNVEDIPKFSPQMSDAIVYANDPEIKSYLKDGRYYGIFDQKIAVIPGRDVTIPSMQFRYFDKATQHSVAKQTPPYEIKVIGADVRSSAPVAQSASPIETASSSAPALPDASKTIDLYGAAAIFMTGVVTGIAALWLLGLWRREHPEKELKAAPLAQRIKKAKDDKALFELLLPLKGQSAVIDDVLDRLEANLYAGGSDRIDKKALLRRIDDPNEEPIELI